MNDQRTDDALSKVPAITLGFWIAKIFATTLGETAGDAVSMSWLGETTPGARVACSVRELPGWCRLMNCARRAMR